MSLVDTIYTYKFIKMLATPWVDQPAYKLGIIDDKGKVLKKTNELKTDAEKKAYTPFHRLGWNLKRIVQKMPGGSTKFANYASALFLLRENNYRTSLTSTDLSMIENTLNKCLPSHLTKHFKESDNAGIKMINEEPTNVIGDSGENDNIDTFDPIMKGMRRR